MNIGRQGNELFAVFITMGGMHGRLWVTIAKKTTLLGDSLYGDVCRADMVAA